MKSMKQSAKLTANIYFKDLEVPFVEFTLSNGTKGRGLIDTGSESTMIDTNFIKKNKECFAIDVTNQKMNFVGFYGDEKRRIIKISTYIHFGKYAVSLEDTIAANLSGINKGLEELHGKDVHIDIVFGGNFLRKKKVEINYKTNTIAFNE